MIRRLALVFMLAATLAGCGINSVPTAEENAKAKWANVQAAYQRRADLIPNLQATVQGAAASERQILTEVEEAEALASAATSEPRGVVRVLCPPAFAVHQLATHLPAFKQRFPKVAVDLTAPGPVVAVDENFDISILLLGKESLQGDFVARLLARSSWIVCASKAYLDERGRPQHPSRPCRPRP